MAPEDQLACTESLYLPSWVGNRRIASRYTRMMVHEAFKTARMDRPGDTAIDSSRASENWRWRDSPRAWSPCHFSKKEGVRTRLASLEENRQLATTWEVKPPQRGASCTSTRLDVRDGNTRHGIRQLTPRNSEPIQFTASARPRNTASMLLPSGSSTNAA
jgi:hypothetical protein